MCRRPYGFVIVNWAALLATAAILTDLPTGIPRAIGALALVLILPGYTLTMLLPVNLRSSWGTKFVFTVGLSMATTVLGALLLNLTSKGISNEGLIAWACGVTLVASLLALARPQLGPSAKIHSVNFGSRGVSLLLGASIVATLAVAVAWWGAVQVSGPNSTQLWLYNNDQAGAGVVRVGIRNLEEIPRTYRLRVVSGDSVLAEWQPIILSQAEQWQADLSVPSDGSDSKTVEALLYVAGSDDMYRHAVLWLATPTAGATSSSTSVHLLDSPGVK